MALLLSKVNDLIRLYPFLLLLSALVAGILLQQYFSGCSGILWLTLTSSVFIIALLLHYVRSANKWTQTFRVIAIGLAFLFLGASFTWLQDVRHYPGWYGHYLNQSDGLRVEVLDRPQVKERTFCLPVKVTGVRQAGRWVSTRGDLKLYIYRKDSSCTFSTGQILLIPSRLSPIRNSGNPFAFDYATYASRNGLFHQAFTAPEEVKIFKSSAGRQQPLDHLRKVLEESIDLNVNDSVTRSLILATMLNERASLDDELWKAYAATGIVHIIAISGMHVALLAGLLLFLLRLIPHKKFDAVKYLLALICIWLYIALTGFPPSAVRAAAMFSITAVGLMLNRSGNTINIWAAAGFFLLCYNPYWLYDIGVQLSFLAVLSIMLFYAPIKKWYAPGNRILLWLWDGIALSIAAQLLVSPLLLYYFHQFPVMGLVANVPAALFSFVLMYGSVGIFALHLCGISCLWLGNLLTWLTHSFHTIIMFLARHTPELMRQLYIDPFECWLLMAIIILVAAYFLYRKYACLWIANFAAFFFVTDLMLKDAVAMRQKRLVVYNVSRGSLADVFYGKTVEPVYPGSVSPQSKTMLYTLFPARLGFRATTEAYSKQQQVYRVGKASILFLHTCAAIKGQQDFPVDFLVVSNRCAFLPQLWYSVFHPRKIIIDGSLPRWKALQWKQQLTALGAPVHWVQEDGAWIYPEEY